MRVTSELGLPATTSQRCDCAASEVTSLARTPDSRQAQYCGKVRIARARAKASGQALASQNICRPTWVMAPIGAEPRSR